MAMRLSGLMSGMDTESIVEQLVLAKRTKVDDTRKAQTKLQWKTDAWKTLNSKILKFYNGVLGSSMRFEGSYMKKVTKVSNSSVVSVITGENAMNSVQSLKVSKLAKSGYLTGGKLGDGKQGYTADDRLTKLGMDLFDRGTIKVSVGGEEKEINISGAATIGEVVQSFRDVGINASFDATNQRLYLAANGTGTENDFSVYAGDVTGLDMLQKLGLNYAKSDFYDNIVASYLQDRLDGRLNELIDEQEIYQRWKNNSITDVLGKYGDKFEGMDDKSDLGDIKKKVDEILAQGGLEDVDVEYLNKWKNSVATTEAKLSELDKKLEMVDGKWKLKDGEKTAVSDKAEREMPNEVKTAREISKMLTNLGDKYSYSGQKDAGEDAVIELNGVEYTSSRNTFEVNGLTLTVNSTTAEGETVTLTTQDDTDGIYDMIKSFIKEYSELINEMDKLYNAESSRGYEPLTSEEKEAMSESEIEEWETKIKDSLLRKDTTLGSLSNDLKSFMLSYCMEVGGKKMYLTNFGIETLSYFTAAENEKNAYHIDGDPDDPNTAANPDKLRSMIASDPQTVIDFFVGLSRSMYAQLTDNMARTEYSSAYTAYEDVRMKKEYDDYTAKIKELEKKLSDYEDKWYQKFAQMETALAKLQSSASAVTSLLGG